MTLKNIDDEILFKLKYLTLDTTNNSQYIDLLVG